MGSTDVQINDVTVNVELLQGQSEVYKHLFAYADSLVLKSAVELRIADIIHSHGQPMNLLQIASKIDSPSLDLTCLTRVIRMLVRKKIFTVDYNQLGEPLYGLTIASKCLLHDQELSLAPLFLTFTHHSIMTAWHEISRSIKEGGTPFVMAHGESFWNMTSKDPEFSSLFNTGMAAVTKLALDAIIEGYNVGFRDMKGSLVDVGGNVGKLVANIVEAYPHIEGINFDLPHAIANAPQYNGVTHYVGDMFKEIPSADNVIIKSVLHDWADEDCIKILKNCQKAVSHKKGKVIIVDVVLHPDRHEMFDDATVAVDLLVMITCVGGKERTEVEWNNLLKKAGFTHFNIIPLQTTMSLSVIEAFLQ